MSNKNSPLIEFDSVVKRFPGVVANDGVSFKVDKGTIHSLLGENGAGKTTLMNILYGLYQQDKGLIDIRKEDRQVMTSSGQYNGFFNNIKGADRMNQKNKRIN